MAAELFRKLAHRCKPGMQHFSDGVIEARNTDVIGNSNSRFLQRLVHARCSLIRACKKRGGLLSTGQKGFHRQVSEFAILGTNLAEMGFEVGLLHRLAVARGTAREPWKTLIADIPNGSVSL